MTHLALVEGLSLNLPLLLQTVDNVLVAPTNLVGQTLRSRGVRYWYHAKETRYATYLHRAVLATRLQPQHPESLRDNHTLLPVVGRRNALKQLEALKSCRAASSLVGDHTADGPVENLGRCAVVEGAGLFRVDDVAFVKEVVVPQLYKCTESDLPHIHCKRVKAPCCGRSCRKC